MKKKYLSIFFAFVIINGQAQNVGVGTTTPSEKLDVHGNVNISGTIKANGITGEDGQVLTSTGATLSWQSIGSLSGYKHCQMFTTGSSSWAIPAGVTEVMVEAWGGGAGYGDFCGGTSGSYARKVQPVTFPGTINYTIGNGGYSYAAGGNTEVVLSTGTVIALGGVPLTYSPERNRDTYGVNSMNPAGSIADYYMPGNRGTTIQNTFGQKSSSVYTHTVYLGSGGAPVGMLNASINQGNVIYYENNVMIYAVTGSNNTAPLPSSGGAYPNDTGGAGMVIFWWN